MSSNFKFRPCIDIHKGKVKQIVGGSLSDGGGAKENFVSQHGAAHYAALYKEAGLTGGHIIALDPKGSEFFAEDMKQVFGALSEYPGGLQYGGGVSAENAAEYLNAGASHVIATSYVFKDGAVNYENLKKLSGAAGKERLVIDLSCKKKDGRYIIMTDRWQKYTSVEVTEETLSEFSEYCGEFLVHAVDAEGKSGGIEIGLVGLLGGFSAKKGGFQITYAGGISSYDDIELIKTSGCGEVSFTIGSALSLFGGNLDFDLICKKYK